MNYFFVFYLGCGTDIVLVGRLGVREVAAVLVYAFRAEAQPAQTAECDK